ncbi:MAG: aromatic-ring-hydroxylating dioxygenase subunit beta [Steroidobacteraceae bacterium]
MSQAEVERFLYREARLMDEHRYREWLELWAAQETLYWIPCNADDIDPTRQVSILYDDHDRLVQRVERLESGSVLAQQPLPRMRRVVSNIEVAAPAQAELVVHSNFVLVAARAARQELWAGHTVHRLQRTADALQIRSKKVLLVNADQEMPLLQFLI